MLDMGIYTQNSVSLSDNMGRRLENFVFLQVYLTINDENFDREYNGLWEAMQNLGLNEGSIVTLNQSDLFEKEGRVIRMIPAHQFLK